LQKMFDLVLFQIFLFSINFLKCTGAQVALNDSSLSWRKSNFCRKFWRNYSRRKNKMSICKFSTNVSDFWTFWPNRPKIPENWVYSRALPSSAEKFRKFEKLREEKYWYFLFLKLNFHFWSKFQLTKILTKNL